MATTIDNVNETAKSYPSVRTLRVVYRTVLGITRRHGALKLARFHSRLYPGGERIQHPTHAQMIVPGDPHFFGYLVNHEAHIARVIREVVREGDICIDVGANIGYFSTMLAGAVGKTGRVVCYEPESRNYHVLEQNSELAAQSGLTIVAIRAAVSKEEGTLKLAMGEHSTMHHVVSNGDEASAFESVPAVNLAADLPRRGVMGFVRFMKMDVEGHEVAALEGCSAWLGGRSVGTAVVEVDSGENAQRVERMISDWRGRASYWLDGSWHDKPISQIPCRTDVRIDFV